MVWISLIQPSVRHNITSKCKIIKCIPWLQNYDRKLKLSLGSLNYYSVEAKPEERDTTPLSHIRNFCIIAHVDHGKSTLADRLLEYTGAIVHSSENKQVLDRLQVEKERGITVKAVAASLNYNYKGETYLLNLIDTPGHVDFSNEVSRSLSACQGVILLVDANQGVQAQTIANFYLAFTAGLTIIPVLNKIDLKNADSDRVASQLNNLFDLELESVLRVSAKTGLNVEQVLQCIVEKIPPPSGNRAAPFKALLIDSWFDRYRGVICFVYIADGVVHVGDEIAAFSSKKQYTVKIVGKLKPHEVPTEKLCAGEVGYICCNMRNTSEAHVGDTLHESKVFIEPLPSFQSPKAMVFSGLYPTDQSQYTALRSAIEKLALNDPAVSLKVDSNPALGQGWRLGFLGLLHLEVFSQRLEQEYGTQVVLTAPSVTYKLKIKGSKNIKLYGGTEINLSNPALWPEVSNIEEILEPFVIATIITPDSYLGSITSLCLDRRGVQQSSTYIDNERLLLKYLMPLNEIIVDFHDVLKSLTSGYASFDYEDHGYQPSYLVKLNILINGKVVEELATIVHSSKASETARKMVLKLKDMIPRQMVQIALQAAVGGKVLARENIKAFRKDVTAKLYGGDVTRRMKLLKQQSEGKKKMRMIANIQIPHDTFIQVLKHK